MNTNAMTCLNCKAPVEPADAKLFAEVFLCPDCHTQAVHFWERLDKELRSLQVMAKDAIRVSLLEGKFFFPEATGETEVSKRAVLESILSMEEARAAKDAACTKTTSTQSTPTPASTATTPPHVRTLAALGRSSSPKGFPRS